MGSVSCIVLIPPVLPQLIRRVPEMVRRLRPRPRRILPLRFGRQPVHAHPLPPIQLRNEALGVLPRHALHRTRATTLHLTKILFMKPSNTPPPGTSDPSQQIELFEHAGDFGIALA